jgi:hypothetical protein
MADDVLQRYLRAIPKVMNAQINPVINALLQGFSVMDNEIVAQTQNAKEQLFVATAEGTYLDKLANSLGVSRPGGLGLSDQLFQQLIPNLSLKAKQIRKTFYDTANVFWGPLFIYANTQTLNFGPFNVSPGDSIQVIIDDGATQTIKALVGDIAVPGAATAQEIVNILDRIKHATAAIETDSLTGDQYIALMTETPGPRGSVNILQSSMVSPTKLDFNVGKSQLIEQAQRVCVYEINPNELLIEIPAIVPALRRTLLGSAHLHTDGTLSPPEPPDNGIWQGSFLFDPLGTESSYTITGQSATTSQALVKGNVYTAVTVNSTAGFVNQSGYLMFGLGTPHQEQPVKFRGVPNSNTVLIDPSYIFKNTQPVGTTINVLSSLSPYAPRTNGQDLAVYLTSPSDARAITQTILASLAAAGVVVTFVILLPSYKYLIENPYLMDADA